MRSRFRKAMEASADRGASAVEYGLMVAAIAALIVGIVFGFGGLVNTMFSDTRDCMEQNMDNGATEC